MFLYVTLQRVDRPDEDSRREKKVEIFDEKNKRIKKVTKKYFNVLLCYINKN